jgi:transposase-like protein
MESLAQDIDRSQVQLTDNKDDQPQLNPYEEAKEVIENFFDHIEQYVRDGIRDLINRCVKEEFDNFIGAGRYERSENRNNQRNGFNRPRNIITRFGMVKDILIPRPRVGGFESKIIPRWKRRDKKISRIIIDMFIRGVSARKVKVLSREIWGKDYSPSSVSEFNKQLHDELINWLNRPIKEPISYLILDGVDLKIRRTKISNEALLCAVGITESGKKIFLGIMLGGKESTDAWEGFLLSLINRGLKPENLNLVIVDGGKGLLKAISEILPEVKIQRCTVHKMRNVVSKCPVALRSVVPAEARMIFNAKSKKEALDIFYEWKGRWGGRVPKVVQLIEEDLNELLTFYDHPHRRWKKIRTTNIIERAFREFRRRIDSMDSFPNEASCLRIMFSLARMLDEDWYYKPIKGF